VTTYRFNQHNKMTKVIILGEQPEKKELKPIEFLGYLDAFFKFNSNCSKPNVWKNIVLIRKGYSIEGLDLMYAYDDDKKEGLLYLGHFNDGVV
jgi:hypothetical protein